MDSAVVLAQRSVFNRPVTTNGLVNYMRSYAAGSRSFDLTDMVDCSKAWNRLSSAKRERYRKMVPLKDNMDGDMCCPKKRKRRTCKPKPKCAKRRKRRSCPPKPCPPQPCPRPRRRACKPKRSACARKRKTCGKKYACQKPGPIMNNGYLNFLRAFRRKNCGLPPKELFLKAGRAWWKLTKCEKDRYRRQACKVTTSCRHKRRRVCQT